MPNAGQCDLRRTLLRSAALAFIFSAVGSDAHAIVCTVSIADMNFGLIDTLSALPQDATTEVAIDCNEISLLASEVTICGNIRAGSGGATGSVRHVRSGPDVLDYQLYIDASRSASWGAYDAPELGEPRRITLPVGLLGSGTASGTVNLYGRVFGGQENAPTGSYFSTFSEPHVSFYYAEGGDLSCATAAGGGPAQTTFTVQAEVPANCLVVADDLDFGHHGIIDAPITASTGIEINCTPGSTYAVSLDGGLSGATDPELRLMQSGDNTVAYGLYSDPNYSSPWGTASGTLVTGTGEGTVLLPVYGRVLPQQAAPGAYTDTVVVTITYQ